MPYVDHLFRVNSPGLKEVNYCAQFFLMVHCESSILFMSHKHTHDFSAPVHSVSF